MYNAVPLVADKSAFPYALLSNDAQICAPNISLFTELDSTNTYLKSIAQSGAPHGSVVIAQTQTKGHGRFDRSFYSPRDTGLYMSVLYRQNTATDTGANTDASCGNGVGFDTSAAVTDTSSAVFGANAATDISAARDAIPANKGSMGVNNGGNDDALFASPALFTTTAAVAVCRAIQKIAAVDPRIKWVNDVYCRGKKVCGILCEALFDEKQNMCVVIGIGINISTNDFPREIESKAASIFCGSGDSRAPNGGGTFGLNSDASPQNDATFGVSGAAFTKQSDAFTQNDGASGKCGGDACTNGNTASNGAAKPAQKSTAFGVNGGAPNHDAPAQTESPMRLTLAAHVLNELFFALTQEPKQHVMDEYKRRSFVLGKKVHVFAPNNTYEACAESITDDGFLTVRRDDGTTETLNSGEISIKPLE